MKIKTVEASIYGKYIFGINEVYNINLEKVGGI